MSALTLSLLATPGRALRVLHRDERAQDGFEYLLVVGGISVAIILAIVAPVGGGLIGAVLDGTCNAMSTVTPLDCG